MSVHNQGGETMEGMHIRLLQAENRLLQYQQNSNLGSSYAPSNASSTYNTGPSASQVQPAWNSQPPSSNNQSGAYRQAGCCIMVQGPPREANPAPTFAALATRSQQLESFVTLVTPMAEAVAATKAFLPTRTPLPRATKSAMKKQPVPPPPTHQQQPPPAATHHTPQSTATERAPDSHLSAVMQVRIMCVDKTDAECFDMSDALQAVVRDRYNKMVIAAAPPTAPPLSVMATHSNNQQPTSATRNVASHIQDQTLAAAHVCNDSPSTGLCLVTPDGTEHCLKDGAIMIDTGADINAIAASVAARMRLRTKACSAVMIGFNNQECHIQTVAMDVHLRLFAGTDHEINLVVDMFVMPDSSQYRILLGQPFMGHPALSAMASTYLSALCIFPELAYQELEYTNKHGFGIMHKLPFTMQTGAPQRVMMTRRRSNSRGRS